MRVRAASGEVQEESYPPLPLVAPGSRGLAIASLVLGVAGLGFGVWSALRYRGTSSRLRALDVEADERLQRLEKTKHVVDAGELDQWFTSAGIGRYEKTLTSMAKRERRRRKAKRAAQTIDAEGLTIGGKG